MKSRRRGMSDIILLNGNRVTQGFYSKKVFYGADRLIVVDWHDHPDVRGDIHIKLDIKDAGGILRALKEIGVHDILFVFSLSDVGVPSQRAIYEEYGLLTAPLAAVLCCLRKSAMVQKWKEQGLLNRFSEDFIDSRSSSDMTNSYKTIIKPNFSCSSKGITVLERGASKIEVDQAAERAKAASDDGQVIIEEYISGTEYTVEMLGDYEGHVSVFGISKKYHTPYNLKNRIATKLHYNASDVPMDLMLKIADYGIQCYKAIGLKNSLGHLEVMVADDGRICPLEIGARSSGFIGSHLVDEFNDKSFMLSFAGVVRGDRIENGYIPCKDISTIWYFYDIPPGVAHKTTDLTKFLPDEVRSLAWDREQIRAGNTYRTIWIRNSRGSEERPYDRFDP
jgi:hypothetical protein